MITKLRNFILILFATTTIADSENDILSAESLKQMENALHESSTYMTKEAQDEDVAICIGVTRSGKSTLINYLIGNPLIAERLSRGKPIKIMKADNSSGPAIGSGSTSKTTIPTRWILKNFPGMILWDTPGFNDNRGPQQDVTNAFYLYQLLQKVKSLMIILVVDINDIVNDNIKPFLSVLRALENLMKNRMRDCFGSITVIFSKVPDTLNDVPVDMEFLNDLLRDQFLSSSDIDISQVSRDFIHFLINNNKNIGLFKRASKLGPITSDIDVNILSAIKNSERVGRDILKEMNPSISDTSKLYLFKARETLFSMTAFEELQNVMSLALEQKVNDFNSVKKTKLSTSKLNSIYVDLTNIERQLFNALLYTTGLHEKIKILQTIDPSIQKKVDEHNLLEKIKLMEFIDRLLDLKESDQLDFRLQGILLSSISKVKECIISAQLKLGNITQEKHDEQLEYERRLHQQQLENFAEQLLEEMKKPHKKSKGFFSRVGG